MLFNATFNNISAILWRSVLLVEETGVPGDDFTDQLSHFAISGIRYLLIQLLYEHNHDDHHLKTSWSYTKITEREHLQ